jgi:hypothetical protein
VAALNNSRHYFKCCIKLIKMHITDIQYTTEHKTIHMQHTVVPEMPMVAQPIKIFPRTLQNLLFITQFIRKSFNILPKLEYSKSILNLTYIFTYSMQHGPS